MEPVSAMAAIRAADTLAAAGNLQGALGHLEAALKADPNDVRLLVHHAMYLSDAGRLDDAMQSIESARALAPNDPDVHSVLSGVYRRRRMTKEAIAEVRKAVAINPEEPNFQFMLALAYATARAPAAAEHAARHGLRLAPDHWRLRLVLAEVLIRQGRLAEPRQIIEDLQRQDPDNGLIHAVAAALASQTGEPDSADQLLEIAMTSAAPPAIHDRIAPHLAARRHVLLRPWLMAGRAWLSLPQAVRAVTILVTVVGAYGVFIFWELSPLWAKIVFAGLPGLALVIALSGTVVYRVLRWRYGHKPKLRADF